MKDKTPNNVLLNRNEAAEFLGVSKATLEVWATTKRYNLPMVKIGRLVKYRLSDLEAFIERRTTNLSTEEGASYGK